MSTFQHAGPGTTAAHHALQVILQRYGESVAPDFQLPFHGTGHTRGVIRRAVAIAQAIGLSEGDVELVAIAASFHDTVQEWKENPGKNGAILRLRSAGKNEEASAAEAIAWMQARGGYDDRAYGLVREAILATVPAWDAARGTVCQPNLKPESHPVVRAVALADLGVAGMDGSAFKEEADPLFREEQLDIARTLRDAAARADIGPELQRSFRERMLGWCTSQTGFAKGRKLSLEDELNDPSFDPHTKNRIRALFQGFDAAVAASEAVAARRQELSFWDLADDMGYAIPQG